MATSKTNFKYWIAGTALVGVSLCAGAALHAATTPAASVPISLTQQGRILDSTGVPVAGKVAIVFTVYDSPTASAATDILWTETQNVTPDDGYFSAQLGAVVANPFPAGTFDGSVRYLGVKVGSDAEMTPRQAITSVPYAFQASSAANANGALDTRIAALETTPSAFRAHQTTSTQSFTSGISTLVAFNTKDFDVGSEFSTTTGTFTPKSAGYYQVACHLEWGITSAGVYSGFFEADMNVNGVRIAANGFQSDGYYTMRVASALLHLAANDAVTCWGYQSTGAAQTLGSGSGFANAFEAIRISQ
jgi:hypothetical protein